MYLEITLKINNQGLIKNLVIGFWTKKRDKGVKESKKLLFDKKNISFSRLNYFKTQIQKELFDRTQSIREEREAKHFEFIFSFEYICLN